MYFIDSNVHNMTQMSAGKVIEGATAVVVEGMVWGALGKLCRSTLKTIPAVAQAIHNGVALREIAITAEGIPVRIAVPQVVECMEVVANSGAKSAGQKIEQAAKHIVTTKMRGKRSHSYQKLTTATQTRPLDRLKGKELIGLQGVTVQGYGSLPKWIVLDNYKHYLQPEIRPKKNGLLKPSGWHHDCGRKLEKVKRVNGHVIEIVEKEFHSSGIYRFDWGVKGVRKKTSTFFPHEWSKQMVQKKIVEAYKYARKYKCIPELQVKSNNFSLEGFTQEGIKVQIIINQKGTVITAYPVWP